MKTPDKDVVLLSVAEKYFRKTLPALIKVNVYVFVVQVLPELCKSNFCAIISSNIHANDKNERNSLTCVF